MGDALAAAAAEWNRANPPVPAWPRMGGTCPACGGGGCFGTSPGNHDPPRWACYDTDHAATGVGHEGRAGTHPHWFGDALDLAAHERGMTRAQVLRADGFLRDRELTPEERRRARARAEARRREAEEHARASARAKDRALAAALAWVEALPMLTARPAETWTVRATRFDPIPARGVPTARNASGEPVTWTWADLRGMMAEPPPMPTPPTGEGSPKSWLPGWAPTRFNADRRGRGNALASGALVLDLDADRSAGLGSPDLDPERLAELMRAAVPGVAWLAHTSPSSNPGGYGWRWRVVVPLARPVTPDEYAAVADAVALFALLAGSPALEADTGWRQAERFYYLPGRTPHYAHAEGPGLPLSPDVLLALEVPE